MGKREVPAADVAQGMVVPVGGEKKQNNKEVEKQSAGCRLLF